MRYYNAICNTILPCHRRAAKASKSAIVNKPVVKHLDIIIPYLIIKLNSRAKISNSAVHKSGSRSKMDTYWMVITPILIRISLRTINSITSAVKCCICFYIKANNITQVVGIDVICQHCIFCYCCAGQYWSFSIFRRRF